jgi:hypothetical protein
MIIELPVLPSAGIARRYRMGYFAFSNNNLAIRKRCAEDLGMYDPEARTSEDVDICFRTAHSQSWVLCRELDMTIRHKARKSLSALRRQLWGWGIRLGRPYAGTGVKGIYLYWVNGAQRTITRHVEIAHFPWLVCAFVTDFHVAHALALAALLLGVFGHGWSAGLAAGAALVFLWRSLRDVRLAALPFVATMKLAAVHYMANAVFITAAVISGFRHGMVLVPAAVLPPGRPEKSPAS